jgi:hypothetical protein
MKNNRSVSSSILWLGITFILIAILTIFGPSERALGTHVRIVYLHGVWVWTALAAFAAAGGTGLLGLITRRKVFFSWSCALGRSGLIFWITYLPLSLWAMQANWNGLFLTEPRWRMALSFGLGGLIIQIGLALVDRPVWTALGNLLYFILLLVSVAGVENVMHPESPIFTSEAHMIQLYFLSLFALTLLAAWWLTRWLKTVRC